MNSIKALKQISGLLLITYFFLSITPSLNAQENKSVLKDFNITIEKNDNEIIMKCHEGCAWIDLSFKNYNVNQAIDEYGMAELNKEQSDNIGNLTDFLFTITKTAKGISLKGIKGTACIDLSFTLLKGQKQSINQYGMVSEN